MRWRQSAGIGKLTEMDSPAALLDSARGYLSCSANRPWTITNYSPRKSAAACWSGGGRAFWLPAPDAPIGKRGSHYLQRFTIVLRHGLHVADDRADDRMSIELHQLVNLLGVVDRHLAEQRRRRGLERYGDPVQCRGRRVALAGFVENELCDRDLSALSDEFAGVPKVQ